MKSLTYDVVDKILNGFSDRKLITCPICNATIDLASQDIEVKTNFYFCANCGLTLPKPRIYAITCRQVIHKI
jgi:transcription elongation factor Elf1